MIAALFVDSDGPYFGLSGVDPWSLGRDARRYKGPYPVIAHPPCKRWGRYAKGGPSAKRTFLVGDDDGCFAHALWAARTFGGVIEHPEGSYAWEWFGINNPRQGKGWIRADNYGGWTCSVAQGNYGHKSRKMTWLYLNGFKPKELNWKIPKGMMRMDEGRIHIKRGDPDFKPIKRITQKDMLHTPIRFRNELLMLIADDKV